MYDILIKGGTVIDPAQDIERLRDVSVKEGKIACIQKETPARPKSLVSSISPFPDRPGMLVVSDMKKNCRRAGLTWEEIGEMAQNKNHLHYGRHHSI